MSDFDTVNQWIVKHKLSLPEAQRRAEDKIVRLLCGGRGSIIWNILGLGQNAPQWYRGMSLADREDLSQEAIVHLTEHLRSCHFFFCSKAFLAYYVAYGRRARRHVVELLNEAAIEALADENAADPADGESFTPPDVQEVKSQMQAVLACPPVRGRIFEMKLAGHSLSAIARELPRPFRTCRCESIGPDVRIAYGHDSAPLQVDVQELEGKLEARIIGVWEQWHDICKELLQTCSNYLLFAAAFFDLVEELAPAATPDCEGEPLAEAPPVPERMRRQELLRRLSEECQDEPLHRAVAWCLSECLTPHQTAEALEIYAYHDPTFQQIINDLAGRIGHLTRQWREECQKTA